MDNKLNLNDLFSLSRRHLRSNDRKYHRYFLQEDRPQHRLSIIIGQRGVGKTTLMAQHLLVMVGHDVMSKDILYVPTDHFSLSGLSLYEIAEEFCQQGGKLIAFDEIHKYDNWSMELKSIYDTYPELCVLASGSSALEIHKGSHDLTRRAAIYKLQGLSFREYIEINLSIQLPFFSMETIFQSHESIANDIVMQIHKKGQKVLALFQDYLQFGYYPYSVDVPDHNIYFMTLEQNFHTAIEVDLVSVYPSLTGSSVKKLRHLLSYIASSVPFTPNFSKLKDLVDIGDQRTLKSYLKYLEDAGLIRMVMKATDKIKKLEVPEKIYLNNTNQLRAISPKLQNRGTVRELFLLSMLSQSHSVTVPKKGDFLIDNEWTIEVGGKKKDATQIFGKDQACLACDDIELGVGLKIPLWLFGFVY